MVKPNPLLLPFTERYLVTLYFFFICPTFSSLSFRDLISPFSTDLRTNLSSSSALLILDSLPFLFVCATEAFHPTTYFLRPLIIEAPTSLFPVFIHSSLGFLISSRTFVDFSSP